MLGRQAKDLCHVGKLNGFPKMLFKIRRNLGASWERRYMFLRDAGDGRFQCSQQIIAGRQLLKLTSFPIIVAEVKRLKPPSWCHYSTP